MTDILDIPIDLIFVYIQYACSEWITRKLDLFFFFYISLYTSGPCGIKTCTYVAFDVGSELYGRNTISGLGREILLKVNRTKI